MINLVTSFYLSKNVARQKELDETLIHNINCPYISKIHLFLDNNKCFEYLNQLIKDKSKIFIIRIGNQPLYSDLFGYANTLPNKICMISNSDIWLKEIKQKNLINNLQRCCNNVVYALTRHEHDYSSPLIDNYERGQSHDVFMFKSPVHSGLIGRIHHPQNVWGSENVLLYELKKFQYRIFNPCKSIVIVHEHRSGERNEGRIRINNVRSFSVSPTF